MGRYASRLREISRLHFAEDCTFDCGRHLGLDVDHEPGNSHRQRKQRSRPRIVATGFLAVLLALPSLLKFR